MIAEALRVLSVLIGIAAFLFLAAVIGFVIIIWRLFRSWDRAERKYELR